MWPTTTHTLSDLPRTVRGRPLASAGVCGGCYSFSYSPAKGGAAAVATGLIPALANQNRLSASKCQPASAPVKPPVIQQNSGQRHGHHADEHDRQDQGRNG